MILKRFYDEKLAQASYLIACEATGSALIVDPNRDVDRYIRAAEAEGVEITHVTETHIHADFVSGSRELAKRCGARLYLSGEGGERWGYAFARDDDAILLKEGDSFEVGKIRIDALHTPGHTPEHLTFLVTDGAAADRPIGALTGDFLFAGDVGRPDLLERAAKLEGTMDPGARALFQSLQRFRAQPDYLQIWPGHGAGSACGKGLSGVPHSTVGYERLFNWALAIADEDEFVRAVLAGQPEPPRYFAEMKRINQAGPRILGGFARPQRLPGARIRSLRDADGLVIDIRHAADFAAGHVPGSINIPLNKAFTTWAGWLIPYDRDVHLLLDDSCEQCLDEAVRSLAMIGLDRVAGYFGTEAIEAFGAEGSREVVPQIAVDELTDRLRRREAMVVLDVRGAAEFDAGHIPGARNIPVGHLSDRLDEIARDKPVVVHCQSGARSAIAASVLQARGFANVVQFAGGYPAWQAAGNPTERDGSVNHLRSRDPFHRPPR